MIENKDSQDERLELDEIFNSMGVVLPMTRSIADTTDSYYEGLAREIGNLLLGKRSILYPFCVSLHYVPFLLGFKSLLFMCLYRSSKFVATGWNDDFDGSLLCIQ